MSAHFPGIGCVGLRELRGMGCDGSREPVLAGCGSTRRGYVPVGSVAPSLALTVDPHPARTGPLSRAVSSPENQEVTHEAHVVAIECVIDVEGAAKGRCDRSESDRMRQGWRVRAPRDGFTACRTRTCHSGPVNLRSHSRGPVNPRSHHSSPVNRQSHPRAPGHPPNNTAIRASCPAPGYNAPIATSPEMARAGSLTFTHQGS